MTKVTVKNIHSGDRTPPSGYSSWLNYWKAQKNYSSAHTVYCANLDCKQEAKHGGHVKRVYSTDNSWYIVPLCVRCNEDKDKIFEVDSNSMVSVR